MANAANEFEQLFARAMQQPGIAEISETLRIAQASQQILHEMRPATALVFTSADSTPLHAVTQAA